jgi:hypothetical protein
VEYRRRGRAIPGGSTENTVALGYELHIRKIVLLGFDTLLPRDRIVPIDDPAFVAVKDAPEYMEPREPVIHAAHFWFAWVVFRPETEARESVESLTP